MLALVLQVCRCAQDEFMVVYIHVIHSREWRFQETLVVYFEPGRGN